MRKAIQRRLQHGRPRARSPNHEEWLVMVHASTLIKVLAALVGQTLGAIGLDL